MARTVPSYRIAAEMERSKWKIFRQWLDKKDKKIFDQMFSSSRLQNKFGWISADVLLRTRDTQYYMISSMARCHNFEHTHLQ